jgi:hypothetical protein
MANCEFCGAPPVFKKGDRVALNSNWFVASLGMGRQVGSKATVLGLSRTKYCVRVLFDGLKKPQIFHQSFFNFVRREPMFDQT